MRRAEDESARQEDDEFVDISQMQLLEAGPSHGPYAVPYAGPPPPLAQPQPYHSPATTSVDDFFALYFTPTTHGENSLQTLMLLQVKILLRWCIT
ncbi:unnamed protein product [Pieris brassicae]|uniref:Uncharacterized protein n=1 Tax=Pieris brassicae TaxID=7116 RepID=A0A9P0TV87_PIEBR|nr:unnamed protein product [Pieris brassicae]